MREIKFRCWNAHSSVMHNWEEMVSKGKINLLSEQKPSYPVMQFTGLIDKNGIEIYDGDILFDGDWNLAVVYDGMSAAFMTHHHPSNDLELLCATSTSLLSVIGNIHQNLSLLK